jgi:hypothetical protein
MPMAHQRVLTAAAASGIGFDPALQGRALLTDEEVAELRRRADCACFRRQRAAVFVCDLDAKVSTRSLNPWLALRCCPRPPAPDRRE